MLVASGFKVITPKTAAQKQKLQNLPAGNVTMIKKGKKTYYVFPDPAHNQAYVGGPKEYRAYQQLRADKKLAREDLQDAEMYQDATMEWSLWEGGEGVWGPMGGPVTILKNHKPTVGYGDITPVSRIARWLAAMEAMTGLLM